MKNSGIVKNIIENKVTVLLYRETACSHCNKCSDSNKITNEFSFVYEGNQKIEIGNIITLELEDKEVLKVATIVYVIPVIFIFFGYFIGYLLKLSEGAKILMSLSSLMISFLGIYFYDKFIVKNKSTKSVKVIKIEKNGGY